MKAGLTSWTALAVLGVLTAAPAKAQQVAGSVESGLQSLAQDIVAKSVAQDRSSIAVLPFPNADGSCSVLSTYLADELIQALFAIPNSPLTIIERNQLEAIVNEIQIGQGGLLNPETTQSLGRVSGVKALTVGTITQIGDRIRINARLVATDTGRTISAAAVSIPRTSDVDSLLRQPVAGEGGTCGVRIISRSRPTQTTDAGIAPPGFNSPDRDALSLPRTQQAAGQTVEGLVFSAKTVARSADKKKLSVVLEIINTAAEPTSLMLISPIPAVIDDAANQASATQTLINGIQICNGFAGATEQYCSDNFKNFGKTTLYTGVKTNLLMVFEERAGEFSGATVSVAASFLKGTETEGSQFKIKGISLSLANLPIGGGQGSARTARP